jgi:foldase protein PrsA
LFPQEIRLKQKLAAMLLLAAAVTLPGCRTSSAPQPIEPSTASRRSERPPVDGQPPLPTTAPAPGDEIVATVDGLSITRRELEQPLLESYGMTTLLNLVQLHLAQEQVRRHSLNVSPENIRSERSLTLASMFPDATADQYETLLAQFLSEKHISQGDFDLMLQTNANLRQLALPQMPGKITDTMVHEAFGELYGENRQIRDIELANMREVAEAKRRLAAGEPFDKVAREMSNDPASRALGGELPPFSIQNPNISKVIKDAAFHRQIGEVSDPLQDGDSYHLIMLENIIPPKLVKYDDVKDVVRKELEDTLMTSAIQAMRTQLGQLAMQSLQIDDPILKQKWQEMLDQAQTRQHDRDAIRSDLARHRPTTAAATEPATPQALPPATRP